MGGMWLDRVGWDGKRRWDAIGVVGVVAIQTYLSPLHMEADLPTISARTGGGAAAGHSLHTHTYDTPCKRPAYLPQANASASFRVRCRDNLWVRTNCRRSCKLCVLRPSRAAALFLHPLRAKRRQRRQQGE